MKFYHHRLQGLLANYRAEHGYVEFAIDWEGFRTEKQREKFRILSEGRWHDDRFYAGYSLMVLHYAKTLDETEDQGVVDNMLINPHAGVRFNAFFDFDIRLGYLQSMQRDRRTGGWLTPKGGELHVSMSRWGLKLENRLFVGQNMLPLWKIYGHDLYECNTFFGVTDHIYNRTALSYGNSFFRRTLKVEAALVLQYDGVGCGLQQILKIGVNLEKCSPERKNSPHGPAEREKNRYICTPEKTVRGRAPKRTNENQIYGYRNKRSTGREKSVNFLEEIIQESIAKGETRVQTRFPPEPNGYLHIGHAKSICINFGLAKKYGGKCNLRFDDTNPTKEDVEYVDSIKRDIRWLGFDWAVERYASDYFEQLYEWALVLIRKGLAYVDDQTQEQIREGRGTVSEPGKESPWRNRTVEENLDLFGRMKNGEFADGEKVLRAKIDMAHPNMLFRDPILYRIIHAEHHRTGNKWCIYPMYDYAHGQSDSIEQITHSICTLEFDVHRPLYDWFIQALEIYPSHQYEFARLNLTYTLMSKRKLLKLVQEGVVMGWDDPRMPTICGLRRKGYTPASVRAFAEMVGVAKRDNTIDISKLEYCVREDLNKVAERRMAVLNPLKVVIDNYEEGREEQFEAINNPENPEAGTRRVPFSKVIYIEREDFMEVPPRNTTA